MSLDLTEETPTTTTVLEEGPRDLCLDDPDDLCPIASESELSLVEELRAAALATLGAEACKEECIRTLFRRESLLRYCRARKSIKASTQMLLASVEWRRSFDLEQQLQLWKEDDSPEAQALRQTWPCGIFGTDHRGCPVYYARYGGIDLAACIEIAGFDRVLRLALTEQRQIEEGLMKASRAAGKHLVQVVCVADFDGMQWMRALRSVPGFKRLSHVLDNHFPERLHVGFVACVPQEFPTRARLALLDSHSIRPKHSPEVNGCLLSDARSNPITRSRAPRLFNGIYKMVEPFLAADTKKKVRVCGKSEDSAAALSTLVPKANIPSWMGGEAACPSIPSGQVVQVESSVS